MIFKGKPMKEPADNRLTLIFEASVSIYLYVMLMLTDFKGENILRLQEGWALVILTSGTVIINLAVMLKKFIQLAYNIIKNRWCNPLNPKARIGFYTSN